MVLKKLKQKLEETKAKAHGMTVVELRAHMQNVKEQKREHEKALKEKEREEKEKFEKWKIKEKYKRKKKAVKNGKSGLSGLGDLITTLGGKGPSSNYDPLEIFGSQEEKQKRKKR